MTDREGPGMGAFDQARSKIVKMKIASAAEGSGRSLLFGGRFNQSGLIPSAQ
jgi:hypothetical protein